MVVYSNSSYRHKKWNNSWSDRWNNTRDIWSNFQDTVQNCQFFRNRSKKNDELKAEKINAHHDDVINFYQYLQGIPIMIEIAYNGKDNLDVLEKIIQKIDLVTFDRNKLRINIVGSVLPIINEENPNKGMSREEQSLAHLKDKEYENKYKQYSKILTCQNNLNTKIEPFLDCNRTHVKRLVESNDNEKIELLLRFYLYKIVEASEPNKDPDYLLKHLDRIKISEYEDLYNPFLDKEDEIIQDLKSNYNNISNRINMLKGDINEFNLLISDFQQSLKNMTDNKILGLKGTCYMEKQLCENKIRSLFRRNKRSV